jgi:Ca2+-binding EF-hand superfamily protein
MSAKKRNRFLLPNFEACSVALIAACAIGAAAHAQSPAASTASTASNGRSRAGDSAFARADRNKDGKLSREEARLLPAIFERFDQIDVDRDEFLSRAEFDEALKY